MIHKRAHLILRTRSRRIRILAVLLLASLAWETTAEFTHHHGAELNSSVSQSLLKATQTPNAGNDASSILLQAGKTSGSSSSKTRNECLICQLHQNLSATVFSNLPGFDIRDFRVLHPTTNVVFQLSEFRFSGQGRAPPFNL
jgi:hypothetical protein